MQIRLDGGQFADRNQAHEYLKQALSLPDYYGKNLDALYDCLTELSGAEIQITVPAGKIGYTEKILSVFEEAVQENPFLKVSIQKTKQVNKKKNIKMEKEKVMTKKERVYAVLEGREADHVPAGFSLHFPKEVNNGKEGAESHLKFFRETDTDIIKIMNENLIPDAGLIRVPEDWNKIPTYSIHDAFMQKQLDMVKEIMDKADPDAFSLGTLHGICASGIHPIEGRYGYTYEDVRTLVCTHMRENKKPLIEAYKRITDGLCQLAIAYKELGLDGVYYASLGGEKRYFTDEEFEELIAENDKQIMKAAKEAGSKVFLHICKDGLDMNRYASYADLSDAVNWGVYEVPFSLEEGRKLFPGVCIMGGLANRSGVMTDGTVEELQAEAKRVIRDFGKKGLILGADCTLPTEIPYERIRAICEAIRED